MKGLLGLVLMVSCMAAAEKEYGSHNNTEAIEKDTLNKRLPAFVKTCHRNDPFLNACLCNAIHSLKDRLPVGVPELFLPPLEPFFLSEISVNQNAGSIYLQSSYKNIRIHGLSNFQLINLTVELEQHKLSMRMRFPNISMKANYKMNGKLMMMPLMGEGGCAANLTNVEVLTLVSFEVYKPLDKYPSKYIRLNDLKTTFQIEKAQLRFENLFNGDQALGDHMNNFLNSNWSELIEEVRPIIEEAITKVVRSSTTKIFNRFSYDELLPE